MKTLINSIAALLFTITVYAQSTTPSIDTVTPISLFITNHLTTNLRFSSPILKVDFGSNHQSGSTLTPISATVNLVTTTAPLSHRAPDHTFHHPK